MLTGNNVNGLHEPLLDATNGAAQKKQEQQQQRLHIPLSPSSSIASSIATSFKSVVPPLSLWPLVVLIFFEVSGGPFGTEDAVSSGGPLLTILGFLILPLVWSVPEALITAECATMFPENSGYVAWVTAAFGPFWGFQEGVWSWLSGVTDNSLYPVMLAANLQLFVPELGEPGWPRSVFLVGMALMLSYMNFRGLTVVGHSLVASCLAILVPFVLLVVLAVPHIKPANWLEFEPKAVDWTTFINVMFWNLNYWDSVSTLAGEVRNPGKTFPRALLMAVLLVVAMYLLPTMAALGIKSPESKDSDWGLGYYGLVAQQVGGPWLAVWVLGAAAFSQVGQYQAEMASDSYQLQGMAERGFLPLVLANKSKHGTPTLGIILSSMGVLMLATLSFMEIVELLNAIYCLAELLEFAAFIKLRISKPDLPRPYRVPLPWWGAALMLLPASLLLIFVLLLPFYQMRIVNICTTLGAIFFGSALYYLLQVARNHNWCAFNPLHFDVEGVWGPRVSCSPAWPEDNYGVVGVQPEVPEEEAEEVERMNEYAPLTGPSRISISRGHSAGSNHGTYVRGGSTDGQSSRSIGKATSKAARRASMQGPPSTEKNGQHTVVVLPFPSEQEDGGGRGTAKDGDSRAQPVHGAHAAAPSHSADKSIS
mmetsp:Transcript_23117/g.63828  ORF Transcript_23117/g.63828 Transcript_23117/m.63828 type:complete len:649 (+) Transcript_23117:185-2131(+)